MGEYPIIDGLPIIVADLRNYVSQNIIPILSRNDLSETGTAAALDPPLIPTANILVPTPLIITGTSIPRSAQML